MSAAPPPSGAAERPSLGYQPALDGLRGLALLAIIVYHSGADAAPGAFLSVSTFFTLSGFLITTILLAEHDRDGGVSLRAFWGRRLRRLMPAALATIALLVTAGIWLADTTQLVRLRADALAALLYVANWRFIAAGDSYGASFDSPSPFTHFWTLAIEEQLYVVLPLVVVGALALGRGSRRVVGGVLGGVAVVGIAWSNWLVSSGASIDRLYFGTDVRAVELISGALLAVWWSRRPHPVSSAASRGTRVAGVVALVAMVALWAVADLRETSFYRGGLAAYTLLTLTVILAAVEADGPVRRLLAWKPLAWVGIVSYGAYLLHFPILVWLGQHTSLGPWPRLVIAVPLTFGLAALSARFLERPIRTGRRIAPTRAPAVALGGVAVTLGVVLVASALAPTPDRADLEAALRWQRFVAATEAQEASDAPRVAVFGDSTALMTGRGLSEVSRERPDEFVAGAGWANLGCGLADRGTRVTKGEELAVPADCRDWPTSWREASRERPSDVAVIQVGPWEVTDQRLDDGPLQVVGRDAALDAELASRLRAGIEVLLEHNELVAVLVPPDIEMGRVDGRSPDTPLPESDPARMAAFRRIQQQVVAEFDRAVLVDLAAWMEDRDERRLRPDGVHFTDRTAIEVARWLGPELAAVYERETGRSTTVVKG